MGDCTCANPNHTCAKNITFIKNSVFALKSQTFKVFTVKNFCSIKEWEREQIAIVFCLGDSLIDALKSLLEIFAKKLRGLYPKQSVGSLFLHRLFWIAIRFAVA